MADEADVADLSSATLIDAAIDRIRASVGLETPAPTGHCLWCEAEIGGERRFCDGACRDDYQRIILGRRR